MATDATGTPTSLGIPTYDTAVDAPSGNGNNAQMQAIDALIAARVAKPTGIVSGEAMIWNGTTFVRSSVTGLTPSGIAGYPADATKVLKGDGTWGTVSSGTAQVGNKVSDLTVATDGAIGRLRLMPATYCNSAVTLPAATITVGDTTEFPTAGTLNTPVGVVTYTGKTATTFTGCTGGSGALALNAAVALASGTPASGTYEEVPLIYDATMGKWVSPEKTLVSGNIGQNTGPTTASATFAEMLTTVASAAAVPWRAYDYAGLKPQLRVRSTMIASVTQQASISPSFDGAAIGSTTRNHNGGDDTAASPTISLTTASTPFVSLWGNLPGTYTLYDYFLPGLRGKIAGGATLTAWQWEIGWELRWVG